MTIKATTKALLGTAVSFALLGSVANAADLDNLSDNDLLERIERLEAIIGPGDKYAVRSGNSKVRVTLNGQVNIVAVGFADGDNSGLVVSDNQSSGTRFRILGEAKINESWTAGTQLEFQGNDRSSDAFSQFDRDLAGGTGAAFGTRLSNVFFKHKEYGTVRVGRLNTSSDGSSEVDLSGTGVVSYSSVSDIGAGLNFLTGDDAFSGITLGDVFSNLDGAGRDEGIRYVAPTIAGFTLSATYINSSDTSGGYDVALRYRNKDIAGFGLAAAVAYFDADTSTGDDNRISGSVSVIHLDSGINATFAAGDDNDDGQFVYGKLGIITELNSLGKTAFSADGGFYTNVGNGVESDAITGGAAAGAITLVDTEATNFGFQVLQNIDAAAAEVYAGYKYFDLEDDGLTGVDFDSVHVFYAGSRIKF